MEATCLLQSLTTASLNVKFPFLMSTPNNCHSQKEKSHFLTVPMKHLGVCWRMTASFFLWRNECHE